MEQTNETIQEQEVTGTEITLDETGEGLAEQMIRGIIKSYEDAYNHVNEKWEIQYRVTITNHKLATPDGNKDVAYLRLDRATRQKGYMPIVEGQPVEGEPCHYPWEEKLIHQEVHFFKSMAERVNPKSPWKTRLFVNCLTRLVGAGLEYAELLQRLKQTEEARTKAGVSEPSTEERLNNIGLDKAVEMPKPLTPDETEYKAWLDKERAKEGIK